MLYPDLESDYYPELSKFNTILSEIPRKVPYYTIYVTNHCKTETPLETFIQYTIVTESEDGFIVTRRYSDFDWLMKHLYKKYPLYVLPPMPPKRIFSTTDKFHRQFIDSRQQALERMLQRLGYFKCCLEDNYVQAFLKYKQRDFDEFRHSHKNLSFVTLLQISIHNLYMNTFLAFKGEDSCDIRDESTMECFEILNKRITERSTLMVIQDSMIYLSEESEIFSQYLLWTAQNVADILLLSEQSSISVLMDGVAQLFFVWSSECKTHFSALVSEINPIISEYIAYDNYIIHVIRQRNQTKVNLGLKKKQIFPIESTLKDAAYDSLPKGNKYDQLMAESITLEDQLNDFDRLFYPSLNDWKHQKSRDMATCLNILITKNINYHKSCRDLYKNLLNSITKSDL